MTDDASAPGSQRGQALILAMLVMTVVFGIGAMVLDLGLWLGERRGAQTDADFVALAGAWELLDPSGDPAGAADASLAANQEETDASGKGTAELANLSINGSCVEADVRHSSVSLFSGIFGLIAPDIGAHAKACAGATNAPKAIVPFELDNNDPACFEQPSGAPRFGVLCPLNYGVGGTPREILDLDAGDYCSDDQVGNELSVIASGATGTCLRTGSSCPGSEWYDCVFVRGVDTNDVIDEVRDRIAGLGPCDSPGGVTPGVDDLEETVNVVFDTGDPDTSLYQAKDCDSPRLVSVIVLDRDPDMGDISPIEAFAGFFIEGCHQELLEDPDPGPGDPRLDTDCDDSNGGGSGSGSHNVVYGQFVNLIVENSGVGEARPSTTLFSIALEE